MKNQTVTATATNTNAHGLNSPLENLALAVILQAVKDYYYENKFYERPRKEEAERWILSDGNIYFNALNIDQQGFMKLLRRNSDGEKVIARMTAIVEL